MTELTKADYDDEVQTQANVLRSYAEEDVEKGEYDDLDFAISANLLDVLDAHSWFDGSNELWFHNAIIQHSDTTITVTTDVAESIEGKTAEEAIRFLAHTHFMDDVHHTAKEGQ